MKKYSVAMLVYGYDRVEVEAKNKKEAFKKAKNDSIFRGEGCQFELDEIEELPH